MRFADLERDAAWLDWARTLAPQMWQNCPDLAQQHLAKWMGFRSEYLKKHKKAAHRQPEDTQAITGIKVKLCHQRVGLRPLLGQQAAQKCVELALFAGLH